MNIFNYLRHHAVLAGTVLFVAAAGSIIAGRAAGKKAGTDASAGNTKHVALVDVSSFRSGTSTVSADGIVEAQSQADLKSQLGAPIARIIASIGQSVAAGDTILELENSDTRAQLDQIKGQYISSRTSTMDKIRDAYLKGDSAVHGQIDQLILNNTDPRPQFYVYVVDPQATARIRDERTNLNAIFQAWQPAVARLSASSTDLEISAAMALSQTSLDKISVLLDDMSMALSNTSNIAVTSSLAAINAMQAVVTGARNSMSGAKMSLSGADVSIAGASVRNLEAQLAKTIVRSPIYGRISALPLRVGEYAAPGMILATVVGGDGIQVKAYVSGEDLSRIRVGASAAIQGGTTGIVTSVAPSVSALNRKAEVNVRVLGSSQSLVVGQNVQVKINAADLAQIAGDGSGYSLPIQDLKIAPGEAYVFTVVTAGTTTQMSRIERHDVKLGDVRGDFVQVISGLTDDMRIVSPVYEIEAGQEVIVD